MDEFSGCCGIDIINNFGGPLSKVKQELKEWEKEHRYDGSGLLLVALNGEQRRRYHKTLISEKYKCIMARIHNPRHNSKLFLYAKRTPKRLKREPRKTMDLW